MQTDIAIRKMIAHLDRVLAYSAGHDLKSFTANDMALEASLFNLMQIGELAAGLSEEFRRSNPEIPWTSVIGLRHRLVHDYEGVNLLLIWDIVSHDLPALRAQLIAVATGA